MTEQRVVLLDAAESELKLGNLFVCCVFVCASAKRVNKWHFPRDSAGGTKTEMDGWIACCWDVDDAAATAAGGGRGGGGERTSTEQILAFKQQQQNRERKGGGNRWMEAHQKM